MKQAIHTAGSGRVRLVGGLSGFLFGVGLWVGGMTDPNKVRGFLDVAGQWDPTLIFVLGAAVLVSLLAYGKKRRQAQPWLDDTFELPTNTAIDRRLILGAMVFGVGWGTSGYCPGPALVGLAQGSTDALVFTLAMVVGTMIYSRHFSGSQS